MSATQRRASLPLSQKPPIENASERSSLRRASVATGMLSAPFNKTSKESPRWRPDSYRAQFGMEVGTNDSKEEQERTSIEESIKSTFQKIIEKTVVSIALGYFILFIAFLIGGVTRFILRFDFGILGLWVNQGFIIMMFLYDKREDGTKRMDKLTAFEILTLFCQIFPLFWAILTSRGNSYHGISLIILFQVVLKFLLMNFFELIVEVVL